MSYALNISCDPCFKAETFSGLKGLKFCLERRDEIHDDFTITTPQPAEVRFHRELDVWGIGPMFGFKTSYTFCDCLKTFGLVETSLIVSDAESKDHFVVVDAGDLEIVDRHFKSEEDCVCFTGVHLVTGISYEMCLCDMEIAFNFGWEYVLWINAPAFPFYEHGENGVRSASTEQNLGLQGIFAGLNISF
jgi:hypothetical protein